MEGKRGSDKQANENRMGVVPEMRACASDGPAGTARWQRWLVRGFFLGWAHMVTKPGDAPEKRWVLCQQLDNRALGNDVGVDIQYLNTGTASNHKHQSAFNEHRHKVEHITWRCLGWLRAQNVVRNGQKQCRSCRTFWTRARDFGIVAPKAKGAPNRKQNAAWQRG